jgi:hypothetical protein
VIAIAVAPLASGGHAHEGDVWVLDANLRVQEFTRDGQFVQGTQLSPCSPGVSPDPLARGGIEVTHDSVYVSHPCADEVLRLARSSLATLATAPVAAPKGLAAQLYPTAPAASRVLYVAEPARGRILKLNLADLEVVGSKRVRGVPTDVFVDAFGVLFASDSARNVVHLYGSTGHEFRTLGHRPGGHRKGWLRNPNAIDVFDQNDRGLNGNLLIADTGNGRVQRWTSYGATRWAAAAHLLG